MDRSLAGPRDGRAAIARLDLDCLEECIVLSGPNRADVAAIAHLVRSRPGQGRRPLRPNPAGVAAIAKAYKNAWNPDSGQADVGRASRVGRSRRFP